MKNQSEWNTFYNSGRVEDYLTFCKSRDEKEHRDDRGVKSEHAELYSGFRTGAEGGTHRGI